MRCRHALAVAGLLWYLVPAVCVPAPSEAAEASSTAEGKEAKAEASEPPPPPLEITEVTVRPHVGRVLARSEVAIVLSGGPFENPDDPAEIDVRAVFEPPGGEPVAVPAFWYRQYRADEAGKQIVPQGEGGFRVRYTPPVPGAYTCTVRATAGEREAEAAPVRFQVLKAEAAARGFLRRHESNPTYYQEPRSGRTVFLMGCRLDGHQFGTRKVEKAYGTAGFCDRKEGVDPAGLFATWQWYVATVDALADAGATCVRLPLHSWYLPLEAQGETSRLRGFEVGRYHAGNAWVADRVIERCEAKGLAVLPVTWNYDAVTLKGDARPYAVYGKHKALTERRLRYQVARWSYSPAVLGWTLFENAHFRPTGSDYWKDRLAYLRGLDPNPHFVFNTPHGVDQEEGWHPSPYGYPLADFYEGEETPNVVTGYGTPEHAARLARAGLWASLVGHRAGAIYLHAWHLHEAEAFESVYPPTAAILRDVDLGASTWRKAYFDKVTGPSVHHDGIVGDKERALVFFMRTPAHRDEAYGPLSGVVMRIGDFERGQYAIEWWRPGDTEPFERSTGRCADGTVLVSLPDGLRWHWLATIAPAGE